MKKSIKINLVELAGIFVTLPIFVFFFGWLKIYFAIPAAILLLVALIKVIKDNVKNEKVLFEVSKKAIFTIAIIAFLWCLLAGIGGFFYQTSDHFARNAIFKDLINFSWPVVYQKTGRALVYYFAIWLVPAVAGKLAITLGAGFAVAWMVAKIVLLIYCAVGIFIVFSLISKLVNIKSTKGIAFCALLFIFFSGMDIIGYLVGGNSFFPSLHIEWWNKYYQLSSFTTCLFWVYNQCIIPWIITAVIMLKKETKSLAFWGLIAVPFGPLPFVGILTYCVFIGMSNLVNYVKEKKTSKFFKDVFSLQNIFAILSVGIPYLLFYTSNAIASSTGTKNKIINVSYFRLPVLILLFIIEVMPFLLLTFKNNKKNIFFYATYLMLIFFPMITIGTGGDFCMRATIPAIFMVFIYTAKELKTCYPIKKQSLEKKILAVSLAVILGIGAVTPATEFFRGFYYVAKEKTIFLENNTVPTLSDKNDGVNNFTASGYENSNFFKYLAKK